MNGKVFILGKYKWGTWDYAAESTHMHMNTHISTVPTASREIHKAKNSLPCWLSSCVFWCLRLFSLSQMHTYYTQKSRQDSYRQWINVSVLNSSYLV